MQISLRFSILLATILSLTSCLTPDNTASEPGNGDTGSSLPALASCDKLANDPDGCLQKGAAKTRCVYNFSNKRCEEEPKMFSHPGQTLSAGANYVAAVTTDGDIRSWIAHASWIAHGGVQINESHIHPPGNAFRTVAAVAHQTYENIMATTTNGFVFFAGGSTYGALTSKALIKDTQFTKGPYTYAIVSYDRNYRCSIAQNQALDCLFSAYVHNDIKKLQGIKVRHTAHSFDGACVVDDTLAIHCHGTLLSTNPFHGAIPQGKYERVYLTVDDINTAVTNACALSWPERKVSCWSNSNASAVVGNIPANLIAHQVAVSNDFAVALLQDGHLSCWGDMTVPTTKAVCDEIKANNDTMVTVVAGASLAMRNGFACAVKTDGSPICFGDAIIKTALANALAAKSFKVAVVPDLRFPLD